MSKFTFKLPDIGEGIAVAETVTWHVKVGDRLEEDGKIADVMTDKATVEMESPVAGLVLEVAGVEGAMIAIGSLLVVVETEESFAIASTPGMNRPEVAIIGPDRIIERPIYVADGTGLDRIEKHKLMNISRSCDHRVVDGWDAASFIQALKQSSKLPCLF